MIAKGRPVSLVGFSVGGRVVLRCLEELSKRSQLGLVNVFQKNLKNGQIKISKSLTYKQQKKIHRFIMHLFLERQFRLMRINGQKHKKSLQIDLFMVLFLFIGCCLFVVFFFTIFFILSVFSRRDWLLHVLARTHSLGSFAGTSDVKVAGVETFDVTDSLSSHRDW